MTKKTHSPLIDRDRKRILGCTCGWRVPPDTANPDDAIASHTALALAADGMAKKPSGSAFTGCKVISATMIAQRQVLGETVTAWLAEARAQRPGFQVVDIVVRQSSDTAYHCVAVCIFFKNDLTTKDPSRG